MRHHPRFRGLGVSVAVSIVVLAACSADGVNRDDELREMFDLLPLPETPYPSHNQLNPDRITLGRLLFYDPILGGEKDVACGTCHHPDFDFTDGRQFGAGVSGVGLGPARSVSVSAVTGAAIPLEPRNSQTVLNAALAGNDDLIPISDARMFWDGRAVGLEGQSLVPIVSRAEMRGDAYPGTDAEAKAVALDSALARLREIPEYEQLFRTAFPGEATEWDIGLRPELIDASTLSRAIGAFERELVSRNAPFDRYARGDDNALTDQEKQGVELFFRKAKCGICHQGPMFSNYRFLVVGAPQEGVGKSTLPGDDTGREEATGNLSDRYRFRVPSLRNIEVTAPYTHAGVFDTLEEIVSFYNLGIQPRHPNVSEDQLESIVRLPLGLTPDEAAALVAFLRALTDTGADIDPILLTVPAQVPSGLTPVLGVSVP